MENVIRWIPGKRKETKEDCCDEGGRNQVKSRKKEPHSSLKRKGKQKKLWGTSKKQRKKEGAKTMHSDISTLKTRKQNQG